MQRPMEPLRINESHVNIWVGDVLKLVPNSQTERALFYGVETRTCSTRTIHMIRALPLILLPDSSSSTRPTFLIQTSNDMAEANEETAIFLQDEQILASMAMEDVQFAAEDGEPLSDDFRAFLRTPHPARHIIQSLALQIYQANINIWNDGVSAVRSKK
ncbi:hypothetical protein K470DRAFT_90903 [Piedraia hortae CBS 480.64]|uniref:Uncharacterized protein n=1 Tax=Piedraia hortae CBS 480.64 TaxID=1314780 RepID=A0A6A7BWT5_9PEZI|nr:hypothetical protein K470DRAFT_90903 [Piedraia hortae CBS 480.64]